MQEYISFVILILMLIVMSSASISDWRYREVSDTHWIVLGVFGVAACFLSSAAEYGIKWEYLCLAAGSLMILVDIFVDFDRHLLLFYSVMAILFVAPLYYMHATGDECFVQWLSIPSSYLIFAGMYFFGLLHGGADAKCLIVISMLFPAYPLIPPFPLIEVPDSIVSEVFTFAVSTLFLGSVITALSSVYFVITNYKKGDKGRCMMTGYTMDVYDARSANVWPMHDVVDGKLVRCHMPDDPTEIYDRLEYAGESRIWVTPMIPFIVPLAVASAFIALIGNPLFLISV